MGRGRRGREGLGVVRFVSFLVSNADTRGREGDINNRDSHDSESLEKSALASVTGEGAEVKEMRSRN